jgi:hypothetical protein
MHTEGEVVLKGKTVVTRHPVISVACLLISALLLGGVTMAKTTFAQSTAGKNAMGSQTQCSLSTLKGRYVFSFDGVRVVGSNQVPFAGAGFSIFDGQGHVHGIATQSVNGRILSRLPFAATYTISPDCVVIETFMIARTTLHFDEFTTPDGSVLTFVETDPGVVTSSFAMQGKSQRIEN